MAENNLEKIIGTPRMNNYMANSNLTGTISEAIIIYDDNSQNKLNSVNFLIESSNSKTLKSMYSACNLRREIEAYGVYTKENNSIKIETIKVKY